MEYQGIAQLRAFLLSVDANLTSQEKRLRVNFPADAIASWDVDKLVKANDALFEKFKNANLYAIFTGGRGDKGHTLRYIGKTTRKLARQRIKNHLFKKHEKTGAKLFQVKEHICCGDGGTIEVAAIHVSPESLRNYLEEELIGLHPEADWNRENKPRKISRA